MKKHVSTVILIIIFFIGLAVLLYPSISDIYNDSLHVTAINTYENLVQEMTPEDYSEYWQMVKYYNRKVAAYGNTMQFVNGTPQDEEYKNTLNVDGNGMIGYLEIPKIKVFLPIYHGTSQSVLAAGVGHLEGSSLPGGGAGTHTILSSHTGLPSARLLTDLDQMELGDQFIISVLNRSLLYEVDQIVTVLPNALSDLQIVDGEEYVTLLTCTPYGINSHRLLVRAKFVAEQTLIAGGEEGQETDTTVIVRKDAELYRVGVIAPIAAIPLAIIMLIFLLYYFRQQEDEEKE